MNVNDNEYVIQFFF